MLDKLAELWRSKVRLIITGKLDFSPAEKMFRRLYSTARAHKTPVKTRFPTKYNPVRSAYKQKILLPEGLVYNPSPAAPTAWETPAAFVPKSDKRTVLKDAKPYDIANMPALKTPAEKTTNLTEADAIEIQRLRNEEPEKWTRKALASKYSVSEHVIGILSKPNAERAQEMNSRLATIKSIWNDKRTRAREHRQRRKAFWLRDA
ncbi:54S ribosomal protein L20, mitochondrial [Wickerhamiella sorbophila]|uniref:54S ribosomal protein L20, mitochondrial n=1 Tax=Wickerhamiella sorbophila TaxID=45607 RepID=A0A2T0FEP4_9ASCO|nr:54S ribosomal protein L20, mitochondrial [Wickerhamiella sorbophila]PRT53461.1 54S ribosomal protein L20, mitochondrial [Wickerhamiella sorbophila]